MNKANIFMGASYTGLAGIVMVLAAFYEPVPQSINIAGGLLTVGSCIAMLATRSSDEYTRGLWNSGASFAFATMILLFLLLPFAEGVYDGFHGNESNRDIPAIVGTGCAVLGYYIGFFWKRLRGGL